MYKNLENGDTNLHQLISIHNKLVEILMRLEHGATSIEHLSIVDPVRVVQTWLSLSPA